MDYSKRLAISYYKTIASLNEPHKIYLVQHQETQKIYVKKILDVYNINIYQTIAQNPIKGIPQIIDLHEEDNHLTVIENYVSGCSLLEKMSTSNINIDSIFQYSIELCFILEKLHSFQPPIIHRDIKPSNIIITEHNHVMLLDFNAAKHFTNTEKTDTVLLGTQGYAAPEQYGFGSSTPRTDIYTLGILLKELVSVCPPAPAVLHNIIAKCIQINPADRYQSVSELRSALEEARRPSDVKNDHSKASLSFLPPGFRTLTPWKMLLASPIYLFIFYLCLTMELKDTYGAALWLERFFCLMIMLSIIFCSFNYLDVQRGFPLCKHRSKIVHYIGVLLMDLLLFTTLMILLLVIESLFFV